MMSGLYAKPDFDREGLAWPNRTSSRFLTSGGLRWHIQVLGQGPPIALVHGTGAASHSFRDVAPRLADRFQVVVMDLPGHGFTETPRGEGLSLEGMAASVKGLFDTLGLVPHLLVGHSAGAAIALRIALDGAPPPRGVVAFNGALEPFPGSSGELFGALARLLFLNPLAVQTLAWRAGQPNTVRRLIESTGSRIDSRGLQCYAALFSKPGHVAGALGMMSRWRLDGLRAELAAYSGRLLLAAAEGDLAVPPKVSKTIADLVPGAQLRVLERLGHLAHEEDPASAAALIAEAAGPSP